MERKPTDFYDRAPVRRTWKPPCTERYTRWCERSARELTSYSIEAMRKMPGENSLPPKKGKSVQERKRKQHCRQAISLR